MAMEEKLEYATVKLKGTARPRSRARAHEVEETLQYEFLP